jgi:hypothetical protein
MPITRIKLSGSHIGAPLIYINELNGSARGNFVIRANGVPAGAMEWAQDHSNASDPLGQALNIAGISNTSGVRIVSEFLKHGTSGLCGAKELLAMLLTLKHDADASVVRWCFHYNEHEIPSLEISIPKCDSDVIQFNKPKGDIQLPERITVLDASDIIISLDGQNICVKEMQLSAQRNLALTMLTQPWLVRANIKYQGKLEANDFKRMTITDLDDQAILTSDAINLKPIFTSESWGGNSCIEFVAELGPTKS